MLRKTLLAVVAVVFPLGTGTLIAAVSPASATTPTITANGTATCTPIGGTIKFSPPLFNTGTSNTETATLKAKLNSFTSGCSKTSTNLPAGGILYGLGSASITTTSTNNSANACASLGTSQAVRLKVVWHYKNSAGVVLAKVTPSTVQFSGYDVLSNGATEPGFDLPQDSGGTTSATGSFAGTTSDANVFTKDTVSFIGSKCGSSTGLTGLKLGGAGTAADPSQAITG